MNTEKPIKVKALARGEYPPGHRRKPDDVFYIKPDRYPKGHPKAGKLVHKGKWMIEEGETPPHKRKEDFTKGQAPNAKFMSSQAREDFNQDPDPNKVDVTPPDWNGQDANEDKDLSFEEGAQEEGGQEDAVQTETTTEPAPDIQPEEEASVYSKPETSEVDASNKIKPEPGSTLVKHNRKGLSAMKRPQLAEIAREKGIKIVVGSTNESVVDAILQHQDKEVKNLNDTTPK